MKILVIGGTGLVGSYLLPRLVARRDEIFALTRSERRLEKIRELGCHGMMGDIRNPKSFLKDLPGKLDIIVLLAMPSVKPGRRITRKRKIELRNETNDFFRNSMDLAIQYDTPIILPGGTSYLTENNEIADENWPIQRIGLTEIGKDTDEMVKNAIKTGYPSVIQLIYGKIYGNGGLFRFMFHMMEKGRARIIGKGDNFIPNIHAVDASSAIINSIENLPIGEKIIIADDTPVTQKDFMNHMASLMNQRKPKSMPGFIIKLALGNDFYSILKMNCIVTNAKAKRLLGWIPQYPSYQDGLPITIQEMQESENYFA
jgi:nucleoside-diphosphate-sugar epimerase